MLFISCDKQGDTDFIHAYDIAGRRLCSQLPIALIEAFKVDCEPFAYQATRVNRSSVNNFSRDPAKLIYQGKGSFSGGIKQVTVWEKENIQALKVGTLDFSLTDLCYGHIHLLGDCSPDQAECAEILLGPPLLALLAEQAVFCLHAGAVTSQYGSAIFIGKSGQGKSTLSSAAPSSDWHRLCDDIMPIYWNNNEALLMPRFPQLKCEKQYLNYSPKPLSVVFCLLDSARSIDFNRLVGSEAVITLAKHTVASRIFNKTTLAKNLLFNQKIATTTPIYTVSYPRDFGYLDEVREKIVEKLTIHSVNYN